MQGLPWNRRRLEGSICCSKTFIYFSAFIVPSKTFKLPIPYARMHPQRFTFMHLTDAFIQSDLQFHSGYTFVVSTCVPWESNPQPFALLTQCSTTEPHRNMLAFELNADKHAGRSHSSLAWRTRRPWFPTRMSNLDSSEHRTSLFLVSHIIHEYWACQICFSSLSSYTFMFLLFTFTFSHLADTFIQSDLQLGNTWSDLS